MLMYNLERHLDYVNGWKEIEIILIYLHVKISITIEFVYERYEKNLKYNGHMHDKMNINI